MAGMYTREKIENWVGDFCASDGVRGFGAATREFASEVLTEFMVAACAVRGVEPEEVEEEDVKRGLLERVARLALPASAKGEAPGLCGAFLAAIVLIEKPALRPRRAVK